MSKQRGWCRVHEWSYHSGKCTKCYREQNEVRMNAISAPLIRSRLIITNALLKNKRV